MMISPRDIRLISQKRREEEQFYGFYICRRITCYLSYLFLHTPITPNQITLLWLVSACTGTVFLILGTKGWAVTGILLFHLAYILDGVDGEVARCKNIFSVEGEYLDKLQHYFVSMLIFLGINIGAFRMSGNEIFLFLIPLSCLGSVGNHLIYDVVYRILYLKRFQKGIPGRSEWSPVAEDIFYGPIPCFSRVRYEKQMKRGMKRRFNTTFRFVPYLGYLYELDAILVLTLCMAALDLFYTPGILQRHNMSFLHLLGIFYSLALFVIFWLRLSFLLKDKMMTRWLGCLDRKDNP